MSSIILAEILQTHQASQISRVPETPLNQVSQIPTKPVLNLSLKILMQYLSKRESECAYLLLRGNTIKGIAQILMLSPRTVEHYLDNVKTKLNVANKAELIRKIIELLSHYKFIQS